MCKSKYEKVMWVLFATKNNGFFPFAYEEYKQKCDAINRYVCKKELNFLHIKYKTNDEEGKTFHRL